MLRAVLAVGCRWCAKCAGQESGRYIMAIFVLTPISIYSSPLENL